ncbi:MAG: MFS transporter, partial [Muribaculaceae bacterium]|nr:MFS transporter [Muribaculaceae bacterium]
TTIAPYFVSGLVFGGVAASDISTDMLILPFAALAGIIAIMAIGMRYINLPDIASTRDVGDARVERSIWSFRHLTLGVIAIFFYVGGEVCIGANITMYAFEQSLGDAALITTLYWGGLLVGRLAGSTLSTVPPRAQLITTALGATVLIIAAIALDNPYILAATGLCHSIMWGCIFTLAVKGLGKYTTIASGVFMIGVFGGAVLPLLQGVCADMLGGAWRQTWWIVVACEAFILFYALVGSRPRKENLVD